jgi:hypothetical protein
VSKQIQGPDHHFSAFYEDNAILIQFMMEEFIQSYQLISQIQTLVQNQLDSIQKLSALSSSLIPILGQLVGCLSQQERPSFSRWTKGSLTKFKEYCEQFLHNSSHTHKQHLRLHMAAHQTWITAVHNLELLNSLYKITCKTESDSFTFLLLLKRAFHRLQRRFNQISRSILKVMRTYWDNENVIFCLLRKKDLLSEIYGYDFLHKHLKWSLKASQLVELLVKRYQARGFEDLIPTIKCFF